MKKRILRAALGALIVGGGALFSACRAREDPSTLTSGEIIARLKEHVATAAAMSGPLRGEVVSGEYHYPPPSQHRGGKTGSHIYICPSGKYIITDWADSRPGQEFFDEAGRWAEEGGFLRLDREAAAEGHIQQNRHYLPFTVATVKGQLLMGREYDFGAFLKFVGPEDATGDLLESCHEKVKSLDDAACAELTQRLLPTARH